tara:strand:+ start:767 stop:1534 length:768 start_codon:yes stop_codon:yes gene_type:complete
MIASNVFGQAQQYQTQAGDLYNRMGNFQAPTIEAVGQAQSPTLAQTDLSQYMNPYTDQVIQRGETDIARQREQALNALGAQATSAGAFGGSRFGLAEGETYGQYGRMASDMAANQRQQAYNQAMQSAQFDVTGQRSAAEAAAAREQAARMQNVQSQFAGLGYQQSAASGLGSLGANMFGQGMRGLDQQQAIADRTQAAQQAMLNAGYQQTLANMGYPSQALQTGAGLLSGLPSATMNQAGTPGLFGILGGVGGIG